MKKTNLFLLLIILSLGSMQAQETSPLALNHSKFLGNIVPHYVPNRYNWYWNQITPENSGKWGSVESTRNVMNWGDLDRAYQHAKNNGYKFKFHTFVWGAQEPSWIKNLSKEQQKAEVEEFMRLVAERYPDIDYIDVVNEPLHQPSNIKEALGGDGSSGWDWVLWSFEKAREYFPNAKLHINDYGIISNESEAERYKTIINLLRRKGLIDGIGIQCHHFNVNQVSTTTMKKVLDMLAATNLPIHVSELDITGKPAWESDEEYKTYIEQNKVQDEETQYQRYKLKFPVFWEHESVVGITLWGYIEGATWAVGSGLLNADGSERKAMVWLAEYMASADSKVPNKYEDTNAVSTMWDDVEIDIYPNPATEHITVRADQVNEIRLYDISGKLIVKQKYEKTLNVEHLQPGLYMLNIDVNGKTVQRKLLKK